MRYLHAFILLMGFILSTTAVSAQYGEPEVQGKAAARNLYDEGYRNGIGFVLSLTDFGLGVGGQYRMALSPYTEALITLKIAGLRDPSEQTYTSYWGSKTVPDKYQRVYIFPFTVGIKRRLFPQHISDNFRVYTSINAGAVYAVSYPYFNDTNGNGFQENDSYVFGFYEETYDIFQGWKNPKSHLGWTGDIMMGIDFGDNFAKLQSFNFGFNVNYFADGIQVLQPAKMAFDENGIYQDLNGDGYYNDFVPSNKPRKYFGTAQFTFIFGKMW